MRIGAEDKRIDQRKPATGLKARIKNWDVPVLDISVGGMRLRRPPVPFAIKEKVTFELTAAGDGATEVFAGMGFIRAVSSEWVAVQFRLVRYPMMKFIAAHVNSFLSAKLLAGEQDKNATVPPNS